MGKSSKLNRGEQKLRSIYYNVSHPASFSSVQKLAKAANVSVSTVRQWLMKQEVYTTHFPARKKGRQIGFYNAYHPNATWEVDLSDMSSLQRFNDSYSWMLCVVDVFSRQAQARALKTKSSEEVAGAMQDIFKESGVTPEVIQSDQGGEFLGRAFQALMKKHGILFRIARNLHKASVVERAQRTWKSKMWKYFTHKETYRWIDVLPKLVAAYNRTTHSSLNGLAPNDVNESNAYRLWEWNYLRHVNAQKARQKAPRFQSGDFVRISKHKRTFEKGYTQSFSVEVYKVEKAFYLQGVYMYRLRSITGEVIDGNFYVHELQRVYYTPDTLFKIEHVLHRRVRDGREESFVKWKGWHQSHNSWIPSSWIRKI